MTEIPVTGPAEVPEGAETRPHDIEVLEFDETIPPRPEETVADAARAVPDPAGHGGAPEDPVTARDLP